MWTRETPREYQILRVGPGGAIFMHGRAELPQDIDRFLRTMPPSRIPLFTVLFPLPGASCDDLKAARKLIASALRCTAAKCGEGWGPFRFGHDERLSYVAAPPPPPAPMPERGAIRKAVMKSGYISDDDYPPAAWINGEEGASVARFTIDRNGRVTECQASGATPLLDAQTCALLTNRFRFQPSRDGDGKTIPERKIQRIAWRLPSGSGGSAWPPRQAAAMALSVDSSGTVVECKASSTSGHAARDEAICGYIMLNWKFAKSDQAKRILTVPIPVTPTVPIAPGSAAPL